MQFASLQKLNTNARFWKIMFFLYFGVLIVVSLMPSNNIKPLTINGFDKFIHFVLYFVLAFLMCRSYKLKFILAAFLAASVGFSLEVMQELFTETRMFDPLDMLANILGAIAGAVVYTLSNK